MYFTPPQNAAGAGAADSSARRQSLNRSEEESEKQQNNKGKQREIDQIQNVQQSQQNLFQMSVSLQQRSLSTFEQPSDSSSLAPAPTTTFDQSYLPVDFSQLTNKQPSKQKAKDPFVIENLSLDALIKVKRLMEKSDISWGQVYAERQKKREMKSSSTNEDSDPFPNNDLQSNQFQLDPSNISSDTGESQSLDQSFNGLMPNNLGQYPILHTPLQPGAAALLNMTESLDLSATALQPENSNQAYKPTKMSFSDPFASDRAGKEVQTPAKNAPEGQMQRNSAEVQVEGEPSILMSNTSKRAYPINRADRSPNEDPTGKRERRAGEPDSDQMDPQGGGEVNRIEEVVVMNSNSSPQRGRRTSIKGRSNRNSGGTQRKSLRPRVTKPKEPVTATIVELPAPKENKPSHPDSSSSAVVEQDAGNPTSEADVNDVESQKAQKAIGDLMRQQQLWQNVVSNLEIWLSACNLKLSRIGLQLEEAQRDTVEKQKMQHFHEVEQLVRHDMALNMQQAASQAWMQSSISQGGQSISSFAQQPNSLTTESAPWIFSQPVYSTQLPNVWPVPVQNAPVSMPSSDSTDSTFASQYLEYAPGQFQQIQKSYATADTGNASMESMRTTLKHPTEVNTSSSSSDAASILPATNQNSLYTFTTEEEKTQSGNKPASTVAVRNSLPYTATNTNSLVPQQQFTPTSSHPGPSRAQSVPNRNTKMTRPTSSKGTPGPVKDIHFILTDYGSSGDVTWKADDNELAQRLASKFYLPNQPPFPIRPLHEGVLRRIHDEWLHAHSFSAGVLRAGGHGLPTAYQGVEGTRRYFPPVETNPDATYLRQAWQELERRRILNLANFPDVIDQLRKEAIEELRSEASQRAMMSATMMNALTWANIATQDPPTEAVDNRARHIWERRKAAATYAIGLLRQAEYCVAEGFRAFAVGQSAVPEKEANKTNIAGPSQDASTSHVPPTNQSRHHREKYGKKGEAPSNVYSATLPHGGTGSESDAVLGSPSILSNASFSPETMAQVKRNAPERKSSNDSWDATMMRRIGSK